MCIEHDLSAIARIEAIPKTTLNIPIPVYIAQNVIDRNSFSVPDDGIILPLVKDKAKITDKESVSAAGYLHTIDVSFQHTLITEADYVMLENLRRQPHELFITYFGGHQKLIRTSAEGYQFTYDDDNGTAHCKITLINGQGLTLLR